MPSKDFSRNVGKLMVGTASAQVLAFGFAFIVTRLFTREEFASFEQYTMLITLLSVVATCKFEVGIVQPKEDKDAFHIAVLAGMLGVVVSLCSFVALLFFRMDVALLFDNPELADWLLLVPASVLLLSIFNIASNWLNRQKAYSSMALSRILMASTSEPSKVMFGMLSYTQGGLILATIVGRTVMAIYLLKVCFKTAGKQLGSFSFGAVRSMAYEYRNFFRYTTPGSLVGRTTAWIHILLFSMYYGPVVVGMIALTRRIIMNPLTIVSTSFAQVFFKKISTVWDPLQLRKLYVKNLFALLGIASAAILVVWLLPPNSLGWLFGSEWTETIDYLRVLVFWFGFNFVSSALSFTLHRLNKQGLMLVLDIVNFVLVTGSISYGAWRGFTAIETLWVFVATRSIYAIFIMVLTLNVLNKYVTRKDVKWRG